MSSPSRNVSSLLTTTASQYPGRKRLVAERYVLRGDATSAVRHAEQSNVAT